MDALAGWFLVPLLMVGSSWGIGLLVERLLRTELDGGLVLPAGFAGSLVLLSVPYGLGLSATASTALLALPIAAGFVVGRARLRSSLPPLAVALAALGAYCVHLAPVVLSGSATFAGYGFLGDNAVHFSLVDHVREHGGRMTDLPLSSYGEVLRINLGNGYPLGPHFQLASLTTLLATEVAWLYQGYLATAIALATIPAARLLRALAVGPRVAALGGFAAATAYLPFAYGLQGGAKELIMITLVLFAAVCGARLAAGERPVVPAALLGLATAAAFTVYSTGALPWFLAIIGAALVVAVARSPNRLRTLAVSAGVLAGIFVVGAAVSIGSAVDFFEPARRLLESNEEAALGNLPEGLPPWESMGIWLAGDFRFAPDYPAATYALIAVAAALAALGAVHALRSRALGLLLAAGASIAVWLLVPANIYIEAKLLAILSPALVLLAVAGCVALGRATGRPAAGLLAAALIVGAVLASDGMAYRDVYLAPKDRLEELRHVGERFAGEGPALLVEFEEYGKHFLRDADVIAPFDGYALAPAELRAPAPTYGSWSDLDQLTLAYVRHFPLIVRRRNPIASRPPAVYERVFTGDHYDVWRERAGPSGIVDHLPLGDDADPTGTIDCAAAHRLAAGERGELLVVAEREPPVHLGAVEMERPADWPALPQGGVGALGAGALRGTFEVPGGRYRVWVRGTFGRGVDVQVDGRGVGRAETVQSPEQMALVGEAPLQAGSHTVALVRGGGGFAPGNGRDESYESIFFEPVGEPELRELPVERVDSLCGDRADWVELVEGAPGA